MGGEVNKTIRVKREDERQNKKRIGWSSVGRNRIEWDSIRNRRGVKDRDRGGIE